MVDWFRRWLGQALTCTLFLVSLTSNGDAQPETVWVALLEGRSVSDALQSGATVLDRLPGALILADDRSARALRQAGFAVSEPITLPADRQPILMYAKAPGSALDGQALAALGIEILWRHDDAALVASRDAFPEDVRLAGFSRAPLRSQPLGIPDAGKVRLERALATDFAPNIQEMVDRVDPTTFMQWIEELSGADSILVGDSLMALSTRYTLAGPCRLAEQYVYEQFLALGFTDVQYDPYTSGTTSGRNVVATLPGVTRPGDIVILGAHLDSTSPDPYALAPGANDNASGVAALLTSAAILRDYAFASTIRFIAFTGEEQGLLGSAHYAATARARGDNIVSMVNCDMVAWRSQGTNDVILQGEAPWEFLVSLLDEACQRYTTLNTHLEYTSAASDHVPFQNEGYPAAMAIEYRPSSYPCYHQLCDTSDRNEGAFGAEVTRTVTAAVAQLASPRVLYFGHEPLASVASSGPYEVVASIYEVAPLDPGSLVLHYSTGWNHYYNLPLTSTGTPRLYHAFIPAQAHVTKVSYYLTAGDTQGHAAASPADAPASVHEFYVGPVEALLSEDFEGGATGWTHGGTKDEWQIGTPGGLWGDPAAAHGGSMACGTDLTGLGSYPGRYENGSENWLESPVIDCSDRVAVRLRFWRWLCVERSGDGVNDWARILVNGVEVWESPPVDHLIDTDWTQHELDISSVADNNASVQVRFTLHSNFATVFAGWNLDDIQVVGIPSTTTTDVSGGLPARELVLHPSAPNPLVTVTTLRFVLPAASRAELEIFDVRGRLVRSFGRGVLPAREHRVLWDGRDDNGRPVAAGVYVYRLKTPELSRSRKLMVVR